MRKKHIFSSVFALIVAFVSLAPFCYVVLYSFGTMQGQITVQPYYDVFLGSHRYLQTFWRSLGIGVAVVAGQVFVSILAGYGFAKCKFKERDILFFFLLILMVMPLQVTLVPNYIVLHELGLLDSYAALILPAIFTPLGTFILRQSFRSVPDSILEAAKLDGCGIPRILAHIAVPMNKSGIVCVMLLSFLDAWNMVEQPIAYMKDMEAYPLSVALAYVPPANSLVQFVCCLLVALPPLFLFTVFNKDLVEGITLAEVK